MNITRLNTLNDDKVIIKKEGGGNAGGNAGGGNSGGGTSVLQPNDVNFYDYDGTPLYSYSKDAFLALNEMPKLPTRAGLTCQRWNWSLEDAKAHIEKYGKIDIGATYITDDGKTRLYITIAAEGRMEVPLQLGQSVSDGVVIDWGDGSATETFSGTSTTLKHTYGKVGDYVISLEVTNGTLTLSGSSSYGIFADSKRVYSNMLKKVEIGSGVTSIGNYAFNVCSSLASIVIPDSVTSIVSSAFYGCYSLASIVIPDGVTSIENYAFDNCSSLASIVIPDGVTSIGGSAFYNCYSLASIVIPDSVTSIGGYAFYNCQSVALIDFRTHTSVPTLLNKSAFTNIASDCKIVVPDALYDEWIAATNWSSHASMIVKASEFNG